MCGEHWVYGNFVNENANALATRHTHLLLHASQFIGMEHTWKRWKELRKSSNWASLLCRYRIIDLISFWDEYELRERRKLIRAIFIVRKLLQYWMAHGNAIWFCSLFTIDGVFPRDANKYNQKCSWTGGNIGIASNWYRIARLLRLH